MGLQSDLRVGSGRVRRGQVQPVEQFGAADAEQVAHRHDDPARGQHGVDLGLAVRERRNVGKVRSILRRQLV